MCSTATTREDSESPLPCHSARRGADGLVRHRCPAPEPGSTRSPWRTSRSRGLGRRRHSAIMPIATAPSRHNAKAAPSHDATTPRRHDATTPPTPSIVGEITRHREFQTGRSGRSGSPHVTGFVAQRVLCQIRILMHTAVAHDWFGPCWSRLTPGASAGRDHPRAGGNRTRRSPLGVVVERVEFPDRRPR